MAGKSGARIYSDDDKATVLVTLAANDGNVKRTARDTSVAPATIRKWRDAARRGDGSIDTEAVAKAVDDFVQNAERIRDLALDQLEEKIRDGSVPVAQLITTVGVLDDKITRSKGLPTSHVHATAALPDRDQLRALGEFVAGAIQAAEQRHDEIVDAEVVELPALPSGTTQ